MVRLIVFLPFLTPLCWIPKIQTMQLEEERMMASLTQDELARIQIVMRAIAPIPLLSNLALIICVLLIKSRRTSIGYMQLSLAIMDILCSIGFSIGNVIVPNIPLCTVVGVFMQFCLHASSTWSLLCCVYCFLTIQYNSKVAESHWISYHLYGWGVPTIFTVAMFVCQAVLRRGNVIGDATFECWIAPQYADLRVALLYPILWIHFLIIGILYISIFKMINKATSEIASSTAYGSAMSISYKGGGGGGGGSRSLFNSNDHVGVLVSEENLATSSLIQVNGTKTPPPATTTATTGASRPVSYSNFTKAASTMGSETELDTCSNKLPKMPPIPPTIPLPPPPPPPPVPLQPKKGGKAVEAKLQSSSRKLIAKTCIVAFGFVISWTPATAARIMGLIPGVQIPFWLSMTMGIGFATQGIWNAGAFFIAFFWDQIVN
ncbi:hypothetical protein BDR26DRAFT_918271 [Obelidium mucronatum]|nr:hypothetical protein BDR26DRAFT_918271 [Obelidium mucronatum]